MLLMDTLQNTQNITDINYMWGIVLENIKKAVSDSDFKAWFSNIHPMRLEENNKTFVVGVPNDLSRSWIQNNYATLIVTELSKQNSSIKSIKLTLSRKSVLAKPKTKKAASNTTVPLELESINRDTNLNINHTFDSFILAPYIRLAHAAVESVMDKPGIVYNPLFFYGPTGIGKTHLVQAVGNRMMQNHSNVRVKYISMESFIDSFYTAIRNSSVHEFRKSFDGINLLIVDDVQFIAHGSVETATVELFHIFNTLVNLNCQVIFSSDKSPNEINNLEERMRSRFMGGLLVDIPKVDKESMKIICKEKSAQLELNLDDYIIEYLVENLSPNIREIKGALQNIMLHNKIGGGEPLTLENIKQFIRSNIKPSNKISTKDVIEKVCGYYSIESSLVSKNTRKREIVHSRQIIMYLLREHLKESYSYIGRMLGDRDHTTVMHSVNKVIKMLEEDSRLQRDVEVIKKNLGI